MMEEPAIVEKEFLEMKARFYALRSKGIRRSVGYALTVLLGLSCMWLAFPQPIQAANATAAPCVAHYIVKTGDTTSKIAHTYRLGWWEIAKANNMKPSHPIKVGQTLCIPPKGWASQVVIGTMTSSATGKYLTVTISDVPYRYIWYVKVNAGQKSAGNSYKVGQMLVPANTKVTGTFMLPSSFWKTPRLTVCVKNATTDDRICQKISHTI
jgi:LysM repeat protein